MQRIVSITRHASTSVLRGSGARRPRQFGSTTPTAFADHDIKAKAGAGSDRQPDVPFQVKKEHEQFATNLTRNNQRHEDWLVVSTQPTEEETGNIVVNGELDFKTEDKVMIDYLKNIIKPEDLVRVMV